MEKMCEGVVVVSLKTNNNINAMGKRGNDEGPGIGRR
jgi:hypothetical protein